MAGYSDDSMRSGRNERPMKSVAEPVQRAVRSVATRAMKRVGFSSLSRVQGAWAYRHHAFVATCDRKLRSLAGRAISALHQAAEIAELAPAGRLRIPLSPTPRWSSRSTRPAQNHWSVRSESGCISPLTTVSLGRGLQQQLTSEIATLRRLAHEEEDDRRRALLLGRASALTSHLAILLEATYQTPESPSHSGGSNFGHYDTTRSQTLA